MLRLAAIVAIAGSIFFMADVPTTQAQVVTTYYAPAPTVGVVPVRRGLFGLRTDYVPVVTGTVPVPVTTTFAPAPVTTFYAPAPVVTAPVTTYFAPAPVVAAPVPVRTFYAPVVPAPAPVTTYFAPAPTIYVGR